MTKEEYQKEAAKILRDNITFSGQVGDFVIHGALEKLWELHNQAPNIAYRQLCPKCLGEGRVDNIGTTSSLFRVCPVCNGEKTLPIKKES